MKGLVCLFALLIAAAWPTSAQTISRVAGQNVGASACTSSVAKATPKNVTVGNTVVVEAYNYQGSGSSTVTASGTAILGAWVKDKDFADAATSLEISIWHASVTKGGSLSVTASKTGAFCSGLVLEECSGISTVDTTDSNSGTSATESTHTITTRASGELIVMGSAENSSTNFTYTLSGNALFSDANGASSFTFEAQDTTAAGSYTLTAGTGNRWPWDAVAVAYKPAPPAAPPSSPTLTIISDTSTLGLSCGAPAGTTPTPPPPATHTVSLTWAAPSPVGGSGSIQGYNVYRNSGTGFAKLNTSPVAATSYADATVVSGNAYTYVVTTVDTSGTESAYSNHATATP